MRLFIFITLAIISVHFSGAQPLLEKQIVLLTRVIQKNHYSPKAVNDSFSSHVFDRLIKDLDEYQLYFTQKDLALLESFRYTIDDEMQGKSKGFTNLLAKLYTERLQKVSSICGSLLNSPFLFDTDEYFSYGGTQQPPQDDGEFQLRQVRYIKFKILDYISDESEKDSVKITRDIIIKLEPGARKKVLERLKKKTEESLNKPAEIQEMINGEYLKAIASNFDPHTEFFPPDEKEAFEEELSTESLKYGLALRKSEDGKCLINGLSPGGAAWKSGVIHKDDEILQVKPENDSAINAAESDIRDVFAALDNPHNKKVLITVRSADGIIKTVTLQKELQRNDENIVRSFVLNGAVKAGYINLPSFYTEWDNKNSSSCANDVAKEIVKLKKENIGGLILDLRYNGGGSMQEAIELAGIFIDIGPTCLVRNSDGKTIVLKDPNRGTIYDGPLIIMINGQSASASELVAGTLQDYHRALIVGSSSFGKATMQAIYPLDTLTTDPAAPNQQAKIYGYAKVTEGKLFRITGNTAQLNGVIPDVKIPDAFELADYTERSLDCALPSDTVMKHVLYTPLPPNNTQALASQSNQRISSNPYFTNLSQLIKKHKYSKDNIQIPLKWDAYLQWRQQEDLSELFHSIKIVQKSTAFTIDNSAFDVLMLNLDPYQSEINDDVKKEYLNDKYISEAYNIMNDILKPNK